MNRRSFLKGAAAAVVALFLPLTMESRAQRTIWVTAVDSPLWMQNRSDFVCNGRNDQEVIQQATNLVKRDGGRLMLWQGTFYIDGIDLSQCQNSIIVGNRFVGSYGAAV